MSSCCLSLCPPPRPPQVPLAEHVGCSPQRSGSWPPWRCWESPGPQAPASSLPSAAEPASVLHGAAVCEPVGDREGGLRPGGDARRRLGVEGRGQDGYQKGRRAPHPCPLTTAWAQAPPPNRSPAWGTAQPSAGLTPFLWGLAACQEETRA